MLRLQFSTENAAFEDDPNRAVAAILMDVAKRIQHFGETDGIIKDENGNYIGSFWMKPHDDE